MTRNNSVTLEPFDPEIERTLRKLRNLVEEKVSPKKERPTMEETRVLGVANIAGVGNGAAVGAAAGVAVGAVRGGNHRRTLMEYAQPSIEGTASCIKKPEVHANQFELKPSYVNMIQNSVQFHGLPTEDPNLHIAYFLEI